MPGRAGPEGERMDTVQFAVSVWLKFFFLFTPFFALSMFLAMTGQNTEAQRRKLALRVGGAVGVCCLVLYFFGSFIFSVFGFTLDAFRVGAGALLFLSAVTLVKANLAAMTPAPEEDIAVVPLAMPVIVGPATTGTLLVLGAEITDPAQKSVGCVALLAAVACMTAILLAASWIERLAGRRGINILSKVTGLVLAALAAQMILVGIQHFFATP